jgi:hypothetical protein
MTETAVHLAIVSLDTHKIALHVLDKPRLPSIMYSGDSQKDVKILLNEICGDLDISWLPFGLRKVNFFELGYLGLVYSIFLPEEVRIQEDYRWMSADVLSKHQIDILVQVIGSL